MLGCMLSSMSGIKPIGRHQEKRLTATAVRHLTKPGLHADGHCLYLKIDTGGAKRWIQRIVITGKRRDLGLGAYPLVSLSEAREEALENRKAARRGEDPVAKKKPPEAVMTFSSAARLFHKNSMPTWKNEKHGKQWLSTMEAYAFEPFGDKPIDKVTSNDLYHALMAIWHSHPETARRVKQRINAVFEWAVGTGLRTDNPAQSVGRSLPKHDRSKVQHRLAIPYVEVGAAINKIRASDAGSVTKLAFEFLVLTATRSGETREAVWSEFDLDKAIWTIPAGRMKAKKPHRVPLPTRCIAILREAATLRREGDDLVFPGTKDKKPLSDMTLSKLMKELAIAAVPHGFRSSFRDWAGEQTDHPREVIEFALAHVIKDKAEAAYARSDLFEKRRALMMDWATFLGRTASPLP